MLPYSPEIDHKVSGGTGEKEVDGMNRSLAQVVFSQANAMCPCTIL